MHNYLTGMNDEYLLLMVVQIDLYTESFEVELVCMIDLDFMLCMGSSVIVYFVLYWRFWIYCNIGDIKEFIYVL